MLETVDRRSARGKRDYALLLLLVTYGLRHGKYGPHRGRSRLASRAPTHPGAQGGTFHGLPTLPAGGGGPPGLSRLTRLTVADLSFDRVRTFLQHLEDTRHNQIRTRKSAPRGAAHLLRVPGEHGARATRRRRARRCHPRQALPAAGDILLERDQISALFARLPSRGRHAPRDRALLSSSTTRAHASRGQRPARAGSRPRATPRVRLHGKGDKWRTCPSGRKRPASSSSFSQPMGRRHPTRPSSALTAAARSPGSASTSSSAAMRAPSSATRRRGRRADRATHLPPHDGGAPAGSRCRGQRHPGVARPRKPRHDQPLRRDQRPRQGSRAAHLRAADRSCGGFPRTPVWRDDEALLTWLASL